MVDTIAVIVGVLTLMIGVVTFILTEIDKRKRALQSSLREWQGDIVAYIVDEGGTEGRNFDEIRAKYLAAAHQYKDQKVPQTLLQNEEIRRTLFDLQSKGVIHRSSSDQFICARRADPDSIKAEMEAQMASMMEQWQGILAQVQQRQEAVNRELHQSLTGQMQQFFGVMQEMQSQQDRLREADTVHRDIQRAALEIAGKDPRRYSADQIAIDVMDRTKADRVVVMIQIISLIQSGILTQDDEGRVSIRLFNIPEPVLTQA